MIEESQKAKERRIFEVNPNFKKELSKIPGSEKLMLCFQCGTCTAECPVARFSDSYRPRQIIRMAQLGLKNEVLSSGTIWLCSTCYTCTAYCPQDVELADVVRVLRNMAVKEGYIPQVYRDMISSILASGYAYAIPPSRMRRRETSGLPPLPTGDPKIMSCLADVVGFSKLIKKEVV